MTQFLGEDLGMYVDYGPGPNKHTWGAALLSKFPIINSTHHLLPSPVGELAPAIHATLDIYGQYVDIIVSHNGRPQECESEVNESRPRRRPGRSTITNNGIISNYARVPTAICLPGIRRYKAS